MAAIDAFIKKNADKIELFVAWAAYREKTKEISETDPDRLPFWNSLNDSAHIGLDLIATLGPATTHEIMFHYGTICMPRHITPKDFLAPYFERYSSYYQSLAKENFAESYWNDLITWFGQDLPLHFPMNMLLGPSELTFKHLYRAVWGHSKEKPPLESHED